MYVTQNNILSLYSRKHIKQRYYKTSIPNIYVEQTSLAIVNVGAHLDDDNKECIEKVEMRVITGNAKEL